jgi:hypothetical protein
LVSRSAVAIQFHHEATKHAKVHEVVRALEGGAALVLSCFTPRRQDAKTLRRDKRCCESLFGAKRRCGIEWRLRRYLFA